jgi:hypothetical protein
MVCTPLYALRSSAPPSEFFARPSGAEAGDRSHSDAFSE